MNKDEFMRHIESSRDCEQSRLDTAVNRGLLRAKNDRFDTGKLIKLAAACVFSFAMCITVNTEPVSAAVEKYYQNRNKITPVSAEILDGYIKELFGNLQFPNNFRLKTHFRRLKAEKMQDL